MKKYTWTIRCNGFVMDHMTKLNMDREQAVQVLSSEADRLQAKGYIIEHREETYFTVFAKEGLGLHSFDIVPVLA